MHMYSVSGKWESIADFLAIGPSEESKDALKRWGYNSLPSLDLGDESGDLAIEIYSQVPGSSEPKGIAEQFEFIAAVLIGGEVRHVALPGLPALLEFLKQYAPLAIQVDKWKLEREALVATLNKMDTPR